MKISKKIIKYNGFTLTELLLYIIVMGICVFMISGFLNLVNNAKIKNRLIAEVEQQGDQISSIIRQNILASSGINNPTISAASSSLSLAFVDINRNPTIFNIDNNGNITIKTGADPISNLNNNLVQAENLIFYNLGQANTRGNINGQFTLKAVSSGPRSEYSYLKRFNLTASRR